MRKRYTALTGRTSTLASPAMIDIKDEILVMHTLWITLLISCLQNINMFILPYILEKTLYPNS